MWGYVGLILIIAFIIWLATFRTKHYRLYQDTVYLVINDVFGEVDCINDINGDEYLDDDTKELESGEKIYRISRENGMVFYAVAVKMDGKKYFLAYCRWAKFSNNLNQGVYFVFEKVGRGFEKVNDTIADGVEEKYRTEKR